MKTRAVQALARMRLLWNRRAAYRACFWDEAGQLTPAGADVLADLARFASAQSTTARRSAITGAVDAHATMLAEGRRQLFTRITQQLNVTEAQIYQLMEREHDHRQ